MGRSNNQFTFTAVRRDRTGMLFVAERGNPCQRGTKHRFGEIDAECVLVLRSESMDPAVTIRKAEVELVNTAQTEDVVDESQDPTRSRAKCLLDTLSQRRRRNHIRLRI